MKKSILLLSTLSFALLLMGTFLVAVSQPSVARSISGEIADGERPVPTPRPAKTNVNRNPKIYSDGGVESTDNWERFRAGNSNAAARGSRRKPRTTGKAIVNSNAVPSNSSTTPNTGSTTGKGKVKAVTHRRRHR